MNSKAPRIDRLEPNSIINGNFDFWQRGTSNSTNGYSADRFANQVLNSSATITASQSTDVPTFAQSGWKSDYSLKIDIDSAASVTTDDVIDVYYRMEGYDFNKHFGKTFTVLFWVKSNTTGTYSFNIRNSPTYDRRYITEYEVNSADTWELKAIPITHDGVSTWGSTNGIGMEIMWLLASGSNNNVADLDAWVTGGQIGSVNQVDLGANAANYWQISQVMILPGDHSDIDDIPFRRAGRNIADELQMCQRYYEKTYPLDVVPGTTFEAEGHSKFREPTTTSVFHLQKYTTSKRAIPTTRVYSIQTGNFNFIENDSASTDIAATIAHNGINSFVVLYSAVGNGAHQWHWTADAEL